MNRKKFFLSFLFLVVCTALLTFGANASEGINVTYHTQAEIRAFLANGATLDARTTYDQEPSWRAPYAPGKLSAATEQSALRMLNQVRYIAGLDYNVTISDEYRQLAQAAALVNAATGAITHYPTQPAGMSDALYQLGARGAGSSNLGWGYYSLNVDIVNGWMSDSSGSNLESVGHRRWVLNPSMGKTGFGHVSTHTAMYAFDHSNTAADQYGVMWPAQNTPIEYFGSYYPWSISMGEYVDANSVYVTLKRINDGRTWIFTNRSSNGYFNVDNSGYGQSGCIIFRPDGVGAYNNGDIFTVTINGTPRGKVSYTVQFFDHKSAPLPAIALSGKMSMEGKAMYGQTLRAQLPDSCSWATVKYEWKVNGKVVGTASTYTPTAEDVGKQITVSATGFDRCTGTLTSAGVTVEKAPITGNLGYTFDTLKAGNTFAVDLSGISGYADGQFEYSVTWTVDGQKAAEGDSITSDPTDVGKVYQATVTVTSSKIYYGSITGVEFSLFDWDNPYLDIKAGTWYYDAVRYTTEQGLFNGVSIHAFAPETPLTRGMFVTVLARRSGVTLDNYVFTRFYDVDYGRYYTGAVAWAYENGITEGITPDTFGPNKQITREQLCTMITRYAAAIGVTIEPEEEQPVFADADTISNFAKESVRLMQNCGIVTGRGNNTFWPKQNAKRSEIAVILLRLEEYLTPDQPEEEIPDEEIPDEDTPEDA